MNSPGNLGFDEKLPYVVPVIELEEQPALLTLGNLMVAEVSDTSTNVRTTGQVSDTGSDQAPVAGRAFQ